jgi:hypothetical protein
MVSEVLVFKIQKMGKYYENLDDLVELIKKLEKKHLLAEFILDCITKAKSNPELTPHQIIKEAKKRWLN